MFQFLIGRLGTHMEEPVTIPATLFQFLIGRLGTSVNASWIESPI